jgi:hypothetical protein
MPLVIGAVDLGTYAVVTDRDALAGHGTTVQRPQSGLSHAHAMRLAEHLRGDGWIATVVHVIGDRSYEVDRYPVR